MPGSETVVPRYGRAADPSCRSPDEPGPRSEELDGGERSPRTEPDLPGHLESCGCGPRRAAWSIRRRAAGGRSVVIAGADRSAVPSSSDRACQGAPIGRATRAIESGRGMRYLLRIECLLRIETRCDDMAVGAKSFTTERCR